MKFSEKLRLIRKANNMTQAQFANTIGVSRGNLANIELGNVEPTQVFINCLSLMYNIDKDWLLDENNNDLSVLNGSTGVISLIMEKYSQLDEVYKKFVEDQIVQLLKMQGDKNDFRSAKNDAR